MHIDPRQGFFLIRFRQQISSIGQHPINTCRPLVSLGQTPRSGLRLSLLVQSFHNGLLQSRRLRRVAQPRVSYEHQDSLFEDTFYRQETKRTRFLPYSLVRQKEVPVCIRAFLWHRARCHLPQSGNIIVRSSEEKTNPRPIQRKTMVSAVAEQEKLQTGTGHLSF